MNSPLVAPMSRFVVPFAFSPSSAVMVYVAFLVHQKVGWFNAALTCVARLGSRLPNAIVPPVRNLQVPITVAETETLVLLAAFADPTHAARNTAAITAVTLFIPIFLLAIFLSNSPYRHRHPIAIATRFSRREMKGAMTGPKILIIATNGKTSVFYSSCVGQISDSPEKW